MSFSSISSITSMSEKMALAARMHVMLLSKTGRVTDTEWMVRNREYAEEIIRFATGYAKKENDTDLVELANKFAAAMFPGRAPKTSYPSAHEKPALHELHEKPAFSHHEGANPMRYIGGIR